MQHHSFFRNYKFLQQYLHRHQSIHFWHTAYLGVQQTYWSLVYYILTEYYVDPLIVMVNNWKLQTLKSRRMFSGFKSLGKKKYKSH